MDLADLLKKIELYGDERYMAGNAGALDVPAMEHEREINAAKLLGQIEMLLTERTRNV